MEKIDKQFKRYSDDYFKRVRTAVTNVLDNEAMDRQIQGKSIIEHFDRILTGDMLDFTLGETEVNNDVITMILKSDPIDKRERRYASYQDELGYKGEKPIQFITKPFEEAVDTLPNRIYDEIKGIEI